MSASRPSTTRRPHYIDYYYNRARILNRSAARLAMSSSSGGSPAPPMPCCGRSSAGWSKLEGLIEAIQSGTDHRRAAHARCSGSSTTPRTCSTRRPATRKQPKAGKEENELDEHKAMGGVVAVSLAELIAERKQVEQLLDLAKQVDAKGDESKFEKLREVLDDPESRDEKLIIFTEHRDTLDYLVRRLGGAGLHGPGRPDPRRDGLPRTRGADRVLPQADGGGRRPVHGLHRRGRRGHQPAVRLAAVNWDIPWNPARLEQRMGRIHRYKQQHDPVIIINLVAGKTREGRVMKTLLEKLERIRKELGNDKVFDVIGRLFEGVSIKQYMEQAVSDEGAEEAVRRLEGMLTKEQVEALEAKERRLYGDGGDVKSALGLEREKLQREGWRRLLPGYVRRFIEKSAPLLNLGIEGDLDATFALKPASPGALDFLWTLLESYPPSRRNRLDRPQAQGRHGCDLPASRRAGLRAAAGRRSAGGSRTRLSVAASSLIPRQISRTCSTWRAFRSSESPTPPSASLEKEELLEERLLGFRQHGDGTIQPCPVEHLLLLRGDETDQIVPRRIWLTRCVGTARHGS